MPSLQRSEAAERARLLSVASYTVDLDLTRGADLYGSTTTVRFDCAAPGAETFVELRPAALRRAVLNGRELDVDALRDGRLTLPGLAASNELRVEADMAYSRTGEGLHRFTDPLDGNVYLYSQCAPDTAQRIFACFDQPDLKAELHVSATVPDRWKAIGNGIGTETAPGRWEFAPTPRLSSYLFALCAGPYHSVHTEHDGKPFGLHCRRSLAEHLDKDAEEIAGLTTALYDHYAEIFTEPYPFDSYDQVFCPEYNFGAMENPGCVTFRENYVFRSAVTATERQSRAMVIGHEMAHMWFGDLVTMEWWDDLWLNESFAEYMGYQAVSEATRFTGTWTEFAAGRKAWGYDADQRPSTHPVAPEEVADVEAAMGNFDGISYAKGASALRQLVHRLGRDTFLAGVNDHLARHRFGNATLADFLGSLSRAAGQDVGGWAGRWLRTSGVDTVRVRDDGGVEHTAAGGVRRPHLIDVGLYRLTGDGLEPSGTRALDLPAEDGAPRAVLPAADGPGLRLPNQGDLGYLKIRLDTASRETVAARLAQVPRALDRAVLWTAQRDAVRDGDSDPRTILDLLERHLPDETDTAVVTFALAFAAEVADRYLRPESRPGALAAAHAACTALLDRADDPDLRLVAARGAAATAQTPHEADTLRGWLSAGTVPGGPDMDPGLRWRALTRLCALGAAGADDIAAETERDPSSMGREAAARCRAALPDAAAKRAAWEAVLHQDTLTNALLSATADGFWQPDQGDLLDGYVPRFFTEAPVTAARRGTSVARLLALRLFPAHAATAGTVDAAERCLAVGVPPAFRRPLADQLDDLRRALRSRERHATG